MKSLLTPLMCALLAAPVFAQEKPDTKKPSSADQRIAELERRLDAMSRELETQKTGSVMPAVPDEGRFGMAPSASKVYAVPSGLSIGGYGELLYQGKAATLQDGTHVGSEKTADALRMVLYTGYKFSDRIVFNSEIEFEHGGYSDEHPEGEAIAEFYYLDFLLTKALNIRAGQMLVPMGFINELHEPPAFLGARRPQVEQTLIPSTWHEIGVGVHGDLPGNLSYRVYLMNGLQGSRFNAEGIADGRQDGNKANAQSLAWTGRLDWTPLPGVLVGGSFYTGNSNQTGTGAALTTTVWDAHAEYRAQGLQVRGLYSRATNTAAAVAALNAADPAREVGTRQWGGYLEVGYDLLRGARQALIPYVRYERLDAQQQVVAGVFADGSQDRNLLTTGVAYKPIPQVAVKADWTRDENRAHTGRDQFSLALGYTF
ncbi:TonB-dependent receptor [Geothrix fuzhouensis]|uniref:TonB-dependent receptor n=1 Tax=Geothrix fuzhouensis TaxID=2966451 RepID=UPI00214811B7|nr:TonB-dependent receptor [Geothrix fuzhouensis]